MDELPSVEHNRGRNKGIVKPVMRIAIALAAGALAGLAVSSVLAVTYAVVNLYIEGHGPGIPEDAHSLIGFLVVFSGILAGLFAAWGTFRLTASRKRI